MSALVHCPYCKGDLGDPAELVACAPCGARHHLECFRGHGQCATCGARDALAHRKGLSRIHSRLRLDAMNFVVTVIVTAAISATVTYSRTVDRNESATAEVTARQLREVALARISLEDERARLEREWQAVTRSHARAKVKHEQLALKRRLSSCLGDLRVQWIFGYRRVAQHILRHEYSKAVEAMPQDYDSYKDAFFLELCHHAKFSRSEAQASLDVPSISVDPPPLRRCVGVQASR